MRAAILLIALSGCLSPLGYDEVDDPPIHPGMRLFFAFEDQYTQCTAGFLFWSPAGDAAFLSVSAHCLHVIGDVPLGGPAYGTIPGPGVRPIGAVVFDGWAEHQGERVRDFALIRLLDRDGILAQTSPSVPYWGGPLGLAASDALVAGQAVVAYGNALERGNASDNPTRGTLTFAAAGNLRARLDRPTIVGDSGGPLLTADGLALGILHGSETWTSKASSASLDVFIPLDTAIALLGAEGPQDLQGLRLATSAVWHGGQVGGPAANRPPSSALPSLP